MRATNKFVHCPVCGTRFDLGLTEAMPFCSDRCRQIDFGRWMTEEYGLPWLPHPSDDEDELIEEPRAPADER